MAAKEIDILKKVLPHVFKNRGISVQKAILFGSYARNTESDESDIDLVIVSRDFRGKDIFEKAALTRGVHRELLQRIDKPFDILYYSDTEWEEGNSLMIHAARENGVVVC
jgi:predicted nucleotidyltransferase